MKNVVLDKQLNVKNLCNNDSNMNNNLKCDTIISIVDVENDSQIVKHNDLVNINDRVVNDTCGLIDNDIEMMTHDNFNDEDTVLGNDISVTHCNINNETKSNTEHINDFF